MGYNPMDLSTLTFATGGQGEYCELAPGSSGLFSMRNSLNAVFLRFHYSTLKKSNVANFSPQYCSFNDDS